MMLSVAIVLYLVISLLTWSASDPGPTHSGGGDSINNLGGRFGAWISDLLLAGFGRMVYLLVILSGAVIWRMYTEKTPTKPNLLAPLLSLVGFIITMTGACGLESLYFPLNQTTHSFVAGGILGKLVSPHFSESFGLVGASVIFIGLFFTGVTLVTHLSWFKVMDWIGYKALALVEEIKRLSLSLVDRFKGKQLKKERQQRVKSLNTEFKQKKPPRIEPKIQAPQIAEPEIKERQMSLFADAADGNVLPTLSLLEQPVDAGAGYSVDDLESMSLLLVKKLKDFHIDITVRAIQPGPVITRFEIEPAPGIKASQITGLANDLARSLSVFSVRVVENIPGKTFIGIEIPNTNREIVKLVEGLSSAEYAKSNSPLTLVLGKDIAGNAVVSDITKMPHVLIAGTTGSGKSVCINALILSLVYKAGPDQVRMIMVDPKMLELSVYDGIPHLLTPVITDMKKASNALRWCIFEMDRRFMLMAAVGVRNIAGYNRKIDQAGKKGQPLLNPLHPQDAPTPAEPLTRLPYIVVIVDELADLLMVVGKKIEELIIRVAQRARAAGIHLVLATQRPSVDVVTGLIKANIPCRIAFQVSSRGDSRTVLDQMGAEQLLGQGDMLFLPPGTGYTMRVHGSFVTDEEVNNVVKDLKKSSQPVYLDEIISGQFTDASDTGGAFSEGDGETDELYDQAVRFVTESRRASISAVQRHLRVGYNRAARMIDTMEESGVVGPSENGKREVLVPPPPQD